MVQKYENMLYNPRKMKKKYLKFGIIQKLLYLCLIKSEY